MCVTSEGDPSIPESISNCVYEGTWKDGVLHGIGRIIYANGDYYIGQIENGKLTGTGEYHWANGEFFKGHMKDGMRDYLGEMHYFGGCVYNGEWRNDEVFGYGILTLTDGTQMDQGWNEGAIQKYL